MGDQTWFKEGEPMEDWHGVLISGGRVILLDLSSSGLVGPIPPELAQLSKLSTLSLVNNQLGGEIPPELGQLPLWV